jgi:hypothetical protein
MELHAGHEAAARAGEGRREEVRLRGARVHVRLDVAAHEHDLVAEGIGRQVLAGVEDLVERDVREGVVAAGIADHRAGARRPDVHQARLQCLEALDHALPERVGREGDAAGDEVGIELDVHVAVARARCHEERERIDAQPLPRDRGLLVDALGSHDDVAGAPDRFGQRGIVGRARVRRLGHRDVERDDERAGLHQLVDESRVQLTRPWPLLADVGERRLVYGDDRDRELRGVRGRGARKPVEALELELVPGRGEADRGEGRRHRERDREEHPGRQRARALEHAQYR